MRNAREKFLTGLTRLTRWGTVLIELLRKAVTLRKKLPCTDHLPDFMLSCFPVKNRLIGKNGTATLKNMTIAEALEILKQPDQRKLHHRTAAEVIRNEIEHCDDLALCILANEIKQSMDPEYSYQLMSAFLLAWHLSSENAEKLNSNILLRGLFINKQLGSETVKDGLWKCMVALAACTGATGGG